MHIGVDFDNTMVCYDSIFHRASVEKGLIPSEVPVNKSDVRNYLRRIGNENAWTEIQSHVYGSRMSEAVPYPGVLKFFTSCRRESRPVSVISHKTVHPAVGPRYDLQKAALHWLEQQGFFDGAKIGLPRENVFFEISREAKLERIRASRVTHFIDDLPEVLTAPGFPNDVQRILFDPNELYAKDEKFIHAKSWKEISELLLQ